MKHYEILKKLDRAAILRDPVSLTDKPDEWFGFIQSPRERIPGHVAQDSIFRV